MNTTVLPTPTINSDAIPAELHALPQWVGWRMETREDKPTKVPKNPKTGGNASVAAPTTWASFEDALSAVSKYKLDGIGFVFTESAKIVGIDLDHISDSQGMLEPWAREIVNSLDSYSEKSPSGTGLHILVKAKKPGKKSKSKCKKGPIEIYEKGRWFTMTGAHLEGTPTTICERQAELTALYNSTFTDSAPNPQSQPGRPPTNGHLNFDRAERLRMMLKREDSKALYGGENLSHPSPSEGDLAFCNQLAFWMDHDMAAIDAAFRQSGRMRQKWDERRGEAETYGELTIRKAIEGMPNTYSAWHAGTDPSREGNLNSRSSDSPSQNNPEEERSRKVLANIVGADALQAQIFEPPRWVVEHFILEGLLVLAAKPKRGKSWLMLLISISVALGEMALGNFKTNAGAVLYLCLEDSLARIQGRVRQLLPDASWPKDLCFHDKWPRLDKGGLVALRLWLERNPGAAMIVIDTYTRIKPPKPHNADPYAFDAEISAQLQSLALEFHVAIVLVMHQRKALSDDVFDSISGTLGNIGSADTVAVLERRPSSKDGTLSITGRDIEERRLLMQFEGGEWTCTGDAPDGVVGPLDEAKNFLIDFLRDGPRAATEIHAEAAKRGIKSGVLDSAKKTRGVKTSKSSFKGGWEWSLPVQNTQSS